jgi:hypothetical protein
MQHLLGLPGAAESRPSLVPNDIDRKARSPHGEAKLMDHQQE